MENPKNGLEFLDNLRKKSGGQESTFDDFAEYLEQRARIKGVPIHGQFELTRYAISTVRCAIRIYLRSKCAAALR